MLMGQPQCVQTGVSTRLTDQLGTMLEDQLSKSRTDWGQHMLMDGDWQKANKADLVTNWDLLNGTLLYVLNSP